MGLPRQGKKVKHPLSVTRSDGYAPVELRGDGNALKFANNAFTAKHSNPTSLVFVESNLYGLGQATAYK